MLNPGLTSNIFQHFHMLSPRFQPSAMAEIATCHQVVERWVLQHQRQGALPRDLLAVTHCSYRISPCITLYHLIACPLPTSVLLLHDFDVAAVVYIFFNLPQLGEPPHWFKRSPRSAPKAPRATQYMKYLSSVEIQKSTNHQIIKSSTNQAQIIWSTGMEWTDG